MRTLSIRQPWAWLILNAGKDIENRTWVCHIRSRIQVHTGISFDGLGYDTVRFQFPEIDMPDPLCFDLGGIVGTVDIVDCVEDHDSRWFCGPYGFVLANPEPCEFRAFKGTQRFFDA